MTTSDTGSDRPTPSTVDTSPERSEFSDLVQAVARTPSALALKRRGDTFDGGRYRVERRLGEGGQKTVFLVHDTILRRDCALSLVDPEQVEDDGLRRFHLEAQTLARMGAHPNIVTIYDVGEEHGAPYVLCEYVDGGDLRAAIKAEAPLPVGRALGIARDVCRALACAHARGVVHRDVTPGNIWLLSDGQAKLGDFGLARVSGRTRLTLADSVLGTASYISPEQASGRPVDARCDLYALGCVLYELLTGAPPFAGDSALAVVSQHVHAEPSPPGEKAEGLDPAVSALVMRLLAKAPDRRPAAAGHLLADLERLLAAHGEAPWRLENGSPVPDNEPDRLAAVQRLGVMDTPPELVYDELAAIAAQLCDCPMAYVAFLDQTRQWMKARFGIPVEMSVVPREAGVCQTTICQSDALIVPDLAADARFRGLPPVSGPPHLRFYCGAPLIDDRGRALGTICVMDLKPRELTFRQTESLRQLARQAMAHVELRLARGELASRDEALQRERVRAERAAGSAALVHEVLPAEIATALANERAVEPRYHQAITVGIACLVDYDRLAMSMPPAQLVQTLDAFVSAFDDAARERRLEKLRAVAGSYHFVAGLSEPRVHHPIEACLGAIALREAAARINRARERRELAPWPVRIGLHSGPVMSGVVGSWKRAFDVWGTGATVAARVERAGEPGCITLSESTYQRVRELFDCRPCGSIEHESTGSRPIYELARIAGALSADAGGTTPNDRFFEAFSRRSGHASSR